MIFSVIPLAQFVVSTSRHVQNLKLTMLLRKKHSTPLSQFASISEAKQQLLRQQCVNANCELHRSLDAVEYPKEQLLNNWEYKTVVQHPTAPKKMYLEPPREFEWQPEVDLNSMGEAGWELVSVTSIDHGSEGRTSELRFYFKRLRES